MCILFLARAHKTIIRGETKERKNEDFGNLLGLESSVPDLAPIYLPFITSSSSSSCQPNGPYTSLRIITHSLDFPLLSAFLYSSFDNDVSKLG